MSQLNVFFKLDFNFEHLILNIVDRKMETRWLLPMVVCCIIVLHYISEAITRFLNIVFSALQYSLSTSFGYYKEKLETIHSGV